MEDLALGQYVGLAAETAHALDAAHEPGADCGSRTLELLPGRAVAEQAPEFLVEQLLDHGRIAVRLDVHLDGEQPGDLQRFAEGADAVGHLVAVHEAGVEARCGAAAEYLREQPEHLAVGVGGGGHVPGADEPRLRHAVVHHVATRVAACRDVHLMAGQRRSGGDVAKELLGLFPRRGDVDVAGQHERGVRSAVVLAEPVLGLFQRRALEKVASRDVGRVVRVAFREALRENPVPDLAVGLVLALALLVLHDPALLVDGLLVERAQQVTHPVRFHPQRAVERGGGHVLEIVGAIRAGRAVLVRGADFLEGLEELAAVVLRTLEHQVLEPVRKLPAVGRLVLAADVVPDVDRDDGGLPVRVHDDRQAVVEPEPLEGDVQVGGMRRRRGDAEHEGGSEQWHQGHRSFLNAGFGG